MRQSTTRDDWWRKENEERETGSERDLPLLLKTNGVIFTPLKRVNKSLLFAYYPHLTCLPPSLYFIFFSFSSSSLCKHLPPLSTPSIALNLPYFFSSSINLHHLEPPWSFFSSHSPPSSQIPGPQFASYTPCHHKHASTFFSILLINFSLYNWVLYWFSNISLEILDGNHFTLEILHFVDFLYCFFFKSYIQ